MGRVDAVFGDFVNRHEREVSRDNNKRVVVLSICGDKYKIVVMVNGRARSVIGENSFKLFCKMRDEMTEFLGDVGRSPLDRRVNDCSHDVSSLNACVLFDIV